MIETAEIERMSLAERLQAMELLWRSISRNPETVVSPDWHGELLKKRLAKVEAGKGEFLTIAQLKKRLSKRTS
jgi:putative addiction module component (TIGR02574 family)